MQLAENLIEHKDKLVYFKAMMDACERDKVVCDGECNSIGERA